MIDIQNERVFPLADLPDHVPPRGGKKIAKSTGWRWAKRGVRGVRLSILMCGGVAHTSLEKLQEFFENITAAAEAGCAHPTTTRTREAAIKQADAKCDEMGLTDIPTERNRRTPDSPAL